MKATWFIVASLALIAIALPARAADCAAPLCIDTIEVDGQPAASARDVLLRGPDDAADRKVEAKPGLALAEGSTIEAPTRPRVRLGLVSRNGNAITLQPGGRLRIDANGERGERYAQLLGEARYAVSRALGFFEVTHDRFLAAVKGTEFGVAIDERQSEISYRWVTGRVLVEHDVAVRIQEQSSAAGAKEGKDGEDGSSDRDADSAAVVVRQEVLSDSARELRYRLDPQAYLQEFRTYRDAEQYFRDQLAQDERAGDPQRVAQSLLALGNILQTIGKTAAAVPVFERALELATAQKNQRLEAQVARQAGLAWRELGDYAKATALLQRQLAIEQQLGGGAALVGAARAHIALGRTAGYAGDARAWVAGVQRALAIYRRLDPDETWDDTAAAYKNLADAQWAAGERDAAMRTSLKSLALKQKLQPGGANWAIANSQRDIGLRYLELGNTDAAIDYLQQALAGRIKLFNGVHASIAVSLDDLGLAHERSGDRTQALARFEQALQMRRQLFPDGLHPSFGRSYRHLARLARARGDAAGAADYTARERELRTKLER